MGECWENQCSALALISPFFPVLTGCGAGVLRAGNESTLIRIYGDEAGNELALASEANPN